MDLSIIIPTLNEAENVSVCLPQVRDVLSELGVAHEIIVVDGNSSDDTRSIAQSNGACVITEPGPGYGNALRAGFGVARGRYVITMDADLSHPSEFLARLWHARDRAELLVASRYAPGGKAEMPLLRLALSRLLNTVFRVGLSIPVRDLSSGFRMYKKSVLDSMEIRGRDFGVLVSILIDAFAEGWRIEELPFHYSPRRRGSSHAKLVRFGIEYVRILVGAWRARNSISFADYDERAFYSKIPLQRWWQRRRFSIVTGFVVPGAATLDIGCGSSKIIASLPQAVALDISIAKLRWVKKTNRKLVNASAGCLPFKSGSFQCVICSQVIEHTTEQTVVQEIWRVLRNGGVVVLGTPDYGRVMWRLIERVYGLVHRGGYADEHITHYSHDTLTKDLREQGFRVVDERYICGAELLVKAVKEG